ncbi:MAG: hypothetical protein ABFD63_05620, partial [Smithella sp.]
DEKYEFPANVNSYLRRSHRNLYNPKCCGGGGKFSILEYRYIAGAVDSLCPGYGAGLCIVIWPCGDRKRDRQMPNDLEYLD